MHAHAEMEQVRILFSLYRCVWAIEEMACWKTPANINIFLGVLLKTATTEAGSICWEEYIWQRGMEQIHVNKKTQYSMEPHRPLPSLEMHPAWKGPGIFFILTTHKCQRVLETSCLPTLQVWREQTVQQNSPPWPWSSQAKDTQDPLLVGFQRTRLGKCYQIQHTQIGKQRVPLLAAAKDIELS